MPKPPDNPSVFHEPERQPEPKPTDPSEAKADAALRKNPNTPNTIAGTGQSIYEEPDIFPNRPKGVIDRNFSCSNCGYNLRGLQTGDRCPECGHRELYRPAPRDAVSYQTWLQTQLARTSPAIGWYLALAAAMLGGPLAIFGAMFQSSQGGLTELSGFLLIVIFGPTVEETMKIALAAYVIEVKPYLFRRIHQIRLATLGAAFIFAVIENFVYLNIYVPNPTPTLIAWRWTICIALHVGCTAVASAGLVNVWKQTTTEYRTPRITAGLPRLTQAIIIHGTYNAIMVAWEMAFPGNLW